MSKNRLDKYDDLLMQMDFCNKLNKRFYFIRRIYRGRLIWWI